MKIVIFELPGVKNYLWYQRNRSTIISLNNHTSQSIEPTEKEIYQIVLGKIDFILSLNYTSLDKFNAFWVTYQKLWRDNVYRGQNLQYLFHNNSKTVGCYEEIHTNFFLRLQKIFQL